MSKPRRATSRVAQAGQPCGCWPHVGALFAIARPAQALDPHLAVSQYVFDNWQIQQGLPQNSVEALPAPLTAISGWRRMKASCASMACASRSSIATTRRSCARESSPGCTSMTTAVCGWHARGVLNLFRRPVPRTADGRVCATATSARSSPTRTATSGSAPTRRCSRSPAPTCARYGREQGLEDTAIRALQAGNNGTMWVGRTSAACTAAAAPSASRKSQ